MAAGQDAGRDTSIQSVKEKHQYPCNQDRGSNEMTSLVDIIILTIVKNFSVSRIKK